MSDEEKENADEDPAWSLLFLGFTACLATISYWSEDGCLDATIFVDKTPSIVVCGGQATLAVIGIWVLFFFWLVYSKQKKNSRK